MNEVSEFSVKESFIMLGSRMEALINANDDLDPDKIEFDNVLLNATQKNPWFTRDNMIRSIAAWADALKRNNVDQWLQPYKGKRTKTTLPKTIGVINAGNIPLVGFHDLLCVIMSGHAYLGKNATDDPYLLPYLAEKLIEIDPRLKANISFTERLTGFDAVIATGSNNSARYFDYYFGKYPHVIRMNRNGVAVLTGDEDDKDLKNLGNDIFQYFGLGCRNVSKIFLPRNYEIKNFFEAIESRAEVARHHKYMNNYEYNNAIFLLKRIDFLTNGFLILKEDPAICSPIAVLYYEYYDTLKSLEEKLFVEKENIQCIVGKNFIPFGHAQQPQLWDYSDGIDTMYFLGSL